MPSEIAGGVGIGGRTGSFRGLVGRRGHGFGAAPDRPLGCSGPEGVEPMLVRPIRAPMMLPLDRSTTAAAPTMASPGPAG
jgi:hypothetical protein